MTALVVDGPALEGLAAGVRRSMATLGQLTAVLPAAHAVVTVQAPGSAVATELADAVRDRSRAMADLDALVATVMAVVSTWAAAERTVAGTWASPPSQAGPLTLPPGGLEPWASRAAGATWPSPGWPADSSAATARQASGVGVVGARSAGAGSAGAGSAGAGSGGAEAGIGLTELLASLPPDVLERLLIAAPALALAVVDGPALDDGSARARPAAGSDVPPGAMSSAAPSGKAAAAGSARTGPSPGEAVSADAARLAAAIATASLWAREPRARAVAALLATVPNVRRRRLALLRPQLVSKVASAPPEDRAAACRVLVAADLARLERRLAVTPPGRWKQQLLHDVAQRHELLDGTVLLRHPGGRMSRRPHQLLWFDPRGDGEIVEVLGDLRRARHLAVLVPGTGADLHRYPGSLRRAHRFAAADPNLAVVLWQGADFPDQPFDDGVLPLREHVVAAAYRDAADLAGPALATEVAGLRVAAPRPGRDLTVLGHSYGGSIVGSAEAHGMVVDRVVHIGSAGAYVDNIRDYAAPPGRTRRFSLTTYDDSIRLSQGYDLDDTASRVRAMTPPIFDPVDPLVGVVAARAAHALAGDPSQVGHGADPDLLPGVVRLDPGLHDDGRPVSGHSDMFTPDSTAWRNLLATMDAGRVQVLEPHRSSSHLAPASLIDWPHYVVDRSPWSDPAYRPPVLDIVPRRTP